MKKIVVFAAILGSFGTLKAQKQEGIIDFEQKINMHKRMTDESMKAMIPEFRTTQHQLFFNANESVYKLLEKEDDDDEEMGGGGVKIKLTMPKNELYRNFTTQKKIDLKEMLGKKYLINDTLQTMAWKLGTESKKIKGFECMKATMVNNETQKTIVAWFTPEISCPSGPEIYGTLPGMILEVNVNDGEIVYTAHKITFAKLKPNDLKQPTEGKLISPEGFKKMIDDFRANNGSGIKIMRN